MKNNKNACMMMSMVMVAIIVLLLCKSFKSKSQYTVSPPQPIKVSNVKGGSMFDLPYKLECVPGDSATASYYSRDLSPGGVCGIQEFVQDQSSYTIDN